MFEGPDVSTTLLEEGVIDGRPFLELEIFCISSQVDGALEPDLMDARDARSASPGSQEARV